MMTRSTLAVLLVFAAVAAGCGGSPEPSDDTQSSSDTPQASTDPTQPTDSPTTGGTCLEGASECADIPGQAPPGPPQGGEGDTLDEAAIIDDAEALLGQSEDAALAEEDVRLGRHGDEHLALTEDYVIGRRTIATEDDGTGTYRVIEVTVELTEGPLTITEEGAGSPGADR